MAEILVIRFSALGDLVTLETLFRALRHFHRDDRITLLTSNIGKELYGDTGSFDRIVVDTKPNSSLLARARRLRNHLGLETFDVIYNLQGSSLAHLITLLLKKRRVVNRSSSLWQKLIGMKLRGKTLPEVLRAAGFDTESVSRYFQQPQAEIIQLGVDKRLAEEYRAQLAQTAGDRPIVALAPGASPQWESKKWGDERFAELARRMQDAGFAVIVVGSELEAGAARLIRSRADQAHDFTGRTSVGQLKALLGISAVFVGNDSGPAHVAAAVGTPTVTLFAPTGSIHCVKHLPYRGAHICLTAEGGGCKPCYNPHCPKSRECMAAIGVECVFHAALELAHRGAPSLH